MAHISITNYKRSVIKNTEWVNGILWGGLSLSVILILLKLTRHQEFSWMGASLNINDAWLIFVLLTFGHIYATYLVVQSAYRLWNNTKYKDYQPVYYEIISSGGVFVRNMIPRTESRKFLVVNKKLLRLPINIIIMNKKDPTAWLSLAGIVIFMLSIIPFSTNNTTILIYMIFTAWLLASINWYLGMQWIAALSDLVLTKKESSYLKYLETDIHEEAE